jgi:hypothetical protein
MDERLLLVGAVLVIGMVVIGMVWAGWFDD